MPTYLVRLKPGHDMEWGGLIHADSIAGLLEVLSEEVHPKYYLFKEIQSSAGVMLPLYEFDNCDGDKTVAGSTDGTFRMSANLFDEFNDPEGWQDLELEWLNSLSHDMRRVLEMAENMGPGKVIRVEPGETWRSPVIQWSKP